MECHRCQHREDIEAGKYRGVVFAETPCAKCELRENSLFTIEFDEGRAPAGEAGVPHPVEPVAAEERLPVDVMRELVAGILTLPRDVRDIVCWRFAGMMYRDIAVLQNSSVAAVEARHRRAMARWPALRKLFAEKAAKQSRRKPHGGERWRTKIAPKDSSAKSA